MPAPRITYQRSKQNQLAGIPMKPSGPISYPRWVELLSETAQYSQEVADAGDGGLGWGGGFVERVVDSVTGAAGSAFSTAGELSNQALYNAWGSMNDFQRVMYMQALNAQEQARNAAAQAAQQAADAAAAAAVVPIKVVDKIAPVVTRPVVAITQAATQVVQSTSSMATLAVQSATSTVKDTAQTVKGATLSLAQHIPGVGKRPADEPHEWPAMIDGQTVNSPAEYAQYLATNVYVNPYSHKPISQSEYNMWLSASASNSYVPVGWSVGQPAPTQDQIDTMKTPDYADGYRPATDAEFKAYVAAVDAGNAAATGTVDPTTINQVAAPQIDGRPGTVAPITINQAATPAAQIDSRPVAPITISQVSAAVSTPAVVDDRDPFTKSKYPVPGSEPQMGTAVSTPVIAPVQPANPLTISQAAQLQAPVASLVSTPVIAPVQSAVVEPLTINQAASASQGASAPTVAPKGGAPVGLLAAAGAAAFFLLKK